MCDFASFMARIHNNKLEIKRYDWESHSSTCYFYGITLTEKEEWSEVEWTSEDHDSIDVRHTNIETANAIKAAIIAEFKNRSALLKKYAGKVEGINGQIYCVNNKGSFHCKDGPAIVDVNGNKFWYKNGKRHRENGPAVIHANGSKYWYKNDKCHRENGPAVIYADGSKHWYKNGERHRELGPAVIWASGTKEWYKNGKRHRVNGPAAIHADGTKFWYKNGKYHRENGPAIIWADGSKEWFNNGEPQSSPVSVA